MSILVTINGLLKLPAVLLGWLSLLGFIRITRNLFWVTVGLFLFSILVDCILKPNVVIQGFKQLLGIPCSFIKYKFNLPNVVNFHQRNKYILPFEGEWVVVNGGISKKSSHSWNILSQRYAYDFLIIDDEGKSCCCSKRIPESYYCFGKNILSPADGVVVEVFDKCKESKIFGLGVVVDGYIKDIRGNYIVIRHAWNEYSVLAHLKSSSILVSAGKTVKQGEVIAQCGNTGNTSEPHLHFQLQDSMSFFSSAGLPIKFDNIKAVLWKRYRSKYLRKVFANELRDGFITRGALVKNSNVTSEFPTRCELQHLI